MNRRYQTLSLLMAATITMAIPALAESVCACEPGDTGAGIAPIDPAVARIVQDSPIFPSAIPGSEVIQSGSPGDVTYRIAYLDRNGEADFEAPIMGLANPQQLLAFEILRPDGSFITQTDAIAVPSSNGCTTQRVVRTSATGVSGTQVVGGEAGLAWILMDWTDAVAQNGIVTCDLRVSYNSGGSTPVGVYTVRPSIMMGILSVPDFGQGSVRMQPIGYGPSQDVTTTVYNLLSVTTTVGTGGVVDFGTVRPGEIALGMGGIKYATGDAVIIRNEEASQPINLAISVRASDLVQEAAELPDGGQEVEVQAPGRTVAPISCDKIAIAMERQPTPADAMFKEGGGLCQARLFDTVPTLFPGQQVRLTAGLLEPGVAANNYALAAGRYVGTIEVCLMGPGGQADPIAIGEPPVNPIPSFNADLSWPVDEVGRAQSAA
jgi:hypothetical protein